MRWPLHVIGASGMALLAFVAACAKVPEKIPLAPWRPSTSYVMMDAAARVPVAEVDPAYHAPATDAELREELRFWRERRREQEQAIEAEVRRLSQPAPRPAPPPRQPSRSYATPRLPQAGVWSAAAEAERQERREWVDAELRRRGAL